MSGRFTSFINSARLVRVRCATTGNLTIASGLNAGDTVDGVTLAAEDLILVKDQTDAFDNGIYVCAPIPSRHPEYGTQVKGAGAAYDMFPGLLIAVEEGTANGDSIWRCTSSQGGLLGTDNLAFDDLLATIGGQPAGNYQPLDTDLTDIAALTTTAFGRAFLTLADLAAARAYVGRPKGHLWGISIANGTDATNDINFGAGVCRDNDDDTDIICAALVKQLDANWAAGTNQGMRYSGAAIANTTYFLYAASTAAGTQDYYADPSADHATVLGHLQAETGGSGYVNIRRIGSLLREAGAIVACDWYRFGGGNLRAIRDVRSADVSSAGPGDTPLTITLSVPVGIVVNALFAASIVDATPAAQTQALFTELAQTDTAAAGATADLRIMNGGAGNPQGQAGNFERRTNTSGQIRADINGSTADLTLVMKAIGWDDDCGVSA